MMLEHLQVDFSQMVQNRNADQCLMLLSRTLSRKVEVFINYITNPNKIAKKTRQVTRRCVGNYGGQKSDKCTLCINLCMPQIENPWHF
jgi:hypothetical protein